MLPRTHHRYEDKAGVGRLSIDVWACCQVLGLKVKARYRAVEAHSPGLLPTETARGERIDLWLADQDDARGGQPSTSEAIEFAEKSWQSRKMNVDGKE